MREKNFFFKVKKYLNKKLKNNFNELKKKEIILFLIFNLFMTAIKL